MLFVWPKFGILTLFFPIFVLISVLVYYTIQKKYRWISLLIFSLGFYALIDWKGLLFLFPTSLIVYLFSFLISKYKVIDANKRNKGRNKLPNIFLIIAIVLIGSVLFILKYFNFIGSTFTRIVNKPFSAIDFIVPLGLSYYTFQSIAYLVDVKKAKTTFIHNPFKLILFLSYFPIISMGPICRAEQICSALFEGNDFDEDNIWEGIKRILFGYLKKIVIADMLAIPVTLAFANHGKYFGIPLMLAAILYAIELYCDFSGCVDICIGVSKLFGVKLPENFDKPYIAPTLQIFWRKWHMTLTGWFKDHIYIPLGGNRVKLPRYLLNIMIVWLFTGLWHGANWTFILWGIYNGILLILAALFRKWKPNLEEKYPKLYTNPFINLLRILRTLILVCIGWVIFNSASWKDALRYLYHCMYFWKLTGGTELFLSLPLWGWVSIILAIIFCILLYTPFTGREGYFRNINFKIKPFALPIISMLIVTFVIFIKLYQFSTGNGSNSFVYSDF